MTESNGSVRTFTQPYSAVPYAARRARQIQPQRRSLPLRGGFGALAGIPAGHPVLWSVGGIYPLRRHAAGPDYQSWALGLGRGFGEFGSLGGDVTQAVTRTPSGKRYAGHSLRAQYQKNFVSSGTTFSLASYRYSSSGYYDFAEASALESAQGQVDNRRRRERSRCHKASAVWAVWRFPPGRRNTGTGRVGMRRCISGSTAPGKGSPGRGLLLHPRQQSAKKMIVPGLSISIFRWAVRCPTAR